MKRVSIDACSSKEEREFKKSRHSDEYIGRLGDNNIFAQQQAFGINAAAPAFSAAGSFGHTGLETLSGAAIRRYLAETQAGPLLAAATLPYQSATMIPHYNAMMMNEARFHLASQANILARLGMSYDQNKLATTMPLDQCSTMPESGLVPNSNAITRGTSTESIQKEAPQKKRTVKKVRAAPQSNCGVDHHAHYIKRDHLSLSIDEDPNWLSELQCLVRSQLLEVCWASREDVAVRNSSKKVSLEQVGIRCRFCALNAPGSRAQRSSAFPSSIAQIYQSFTMMLRDHFDNCCCIPADLKERYLALKSATCQGATEAKRYWSYSAQKLGMTDSGEGIIMNDTTRAEGKEMVPFGSVAGEEAVPHGPPVLLVKETDRDFASGFLYALISHFQRIKLLPSERKGNRKSLCAGLPGFGCRYCSNAGRFGMSRVFPARRR